MSRQRVIIAGTDTVRRGCPDYYRLRLRCCVSCFSVVVGVNDVGSFECASVSRGSAGGAEGRDVLRGTWHLISSLADLCGCPAAMLVATPIVALLRLSVGPIRIGIGLALLRALAVAVSGGAGCAAAAASLHGGNAGAAGRNARHTLPRAQIPGAGEGLGGGG
jgi:hypothetical protein